MAKKRKSRGGGGKTVTIRGARSVTVGGLTVSTGTSRSKKSGGRRKKK